jgi:hypothetical protein
MIQSHILPVARSFTQNVEVPSFRMILRGKELKSVQEEPKQAYSQKIRCSVKETKKCPKSWFAWTLCENRRPLLETDDLPADLYAQWGDSGDEKLGHENCSCRPA